MKRFLSLSPKERAIYFVEAEAREGRFAALVYEKDFWVCWLLKKLFEFSELEQYLLFKGGTSLSKVYNCINRFSEDIDVSIHRSFFGFNNEGDPENAKSVNKRNAILEELTLASANYIQKILKPKLEMVMRAELDYDWRLEVDIQDPQTLLFYYPTVNDSMVSTYIKPVIRIEFGARSDNWPKEIHTVLPYVASLFSNDIGDVATGSISVLSKARTFWEKATILHAEFHRPAYSELPMRHSRHFYDLYCLAKNNDAIQFVKDIELMKRVVNHKKVFFRSGWANYESAVKGSFKLVPHEQQLERLQFDYTQMQPMFFAASPALGEVIHTLKELEDKINNLD